MKIWILVFVFTINTVVAEQWVNSHRVNPKYPAFALKANVEGCVTVQFFINAKGETQYVESIASSNSLFEKSAVNAVTQWRYQTDRQHGLTERRKVTLEYKFSETGANTYNIDDCFAELTHESHDINIFRQNRLSTPIFADNFNQWAEQTRLFYGVLSNEESKTFEKTTTNFLKYLKDNEQNAKQVFITRVNGLDYFGFMAKASLEQHDNQEENKPLPRTTLKTNVLPITPIYRIANHWQISDMMISLDTESYQIIEERKLAVEFTISQSGQVNLISFCRDVNTELAQELTEQINDWQLTNLSASPSDLRTVMILPSPQNSAAYIDCEANWHEEQMLELIDMERNRVYR